MNSTPPMRTGDFTRDRFRVYEPMSISSLTTEALMRKPDVSETAGYGYSSQNAQMTNQQSAPPRPTPVPPAQRTVPQQSVPPRPTPVPPAQRTVPQQSVPPRPTPVPPAQRTVPQQSVPPRPTPVPPAQRTVPQQSVPPRPTPVPPAQRTVPQRSAPPRPTPVPPAQRTVPQRSAPPRPTPVPPAQRTTPQPSSPPPQVVRRTRPSLPPPQKLLKKGEKYSITKNHPQIKSFRVGIGWDMATSVNYDVDIEAFMLNETGKVPDDSWIVFYGQLKSPDGAVMHRGDSSEGADTGPDCEQIDVDLRKLSTEICKIAFVITINEAKLYRYNFSGMKNAYIRFIDNQTGKEFIRYELTDYYKEVVSMVVGELYFRNEEWRFNPVGMGTGDDLEGLCNRYGIEVQ